MKITEFTTAEIRDLEEQMEEGGRLDFLFTEQLIEDDKDRELAEVTTEQLVAGGLTEREALLFVLACELSRGDFRDTKCVLFKASR